MKHFSHLNTATQLIRQYPGGIPLHHFLKNFFGSHSKFGSKDRKRISHLCYIFYRVAHALPYEIPVQQPDDIHQIILAGLFLSGTKADDLLGVMKPGWNEMIDSGIHDKIEMINRDNSSRQVNIKNIFPAAGELSSGIDHEDFSISHLIQPDVFIRIRPGYLDMVLQKLEKENVEYEKLPGSAVRLPNGLRIHDILTLDKEVVVQDLNSQRIGEFLSEYASNHKRTPGDRLKVWDCCAASGGKSIMAQDILGIVDLTVSDVRESILSNLKKRFQKAGLSNYQSFIADLSNPHFDQGQANTKDHHSFTGQRHTAFDLIIADLPCTGSGTWSRSPEQLYFFEPGQIEKYSQLQKNILSNILPRLSKTGTLLYITCSVFRKENEDIMNFLLNGFALKVEKMELLKGYDKRADTMFAVLLTRL